MKTSIFTLMLMASVIVCKAQFQTNQKLLGGQFGLSYYQNNPDLSSPSYQRGYNLAASFSLSRFAKPTLLKGGGLFYSLNHTENLINTVNESRSNTHNLGLFLNRTQLEPIAKNLYLSFSGNLGANLGFGKNRTVQSGNFTSSNNYTIYFSGGVGLWYQLNKRFLLTAELTNLLNLSYSLSDYKSYAGTTMSKGRNQFFGLNTGLNGFTLNNFGIGLRYLLK